MSQHSNRTASAFFKIFAVACASLIGMSAQAAKKCVYVNSYHQGYEWSDGIEKGIRDKLKGACDLEVFYMDSKRNQDKIWTKNKADEINAKIERIHPDVVIVSDDNAMRFILVEHFKNSSIPFVFNGVNWTAEAYGLPITNATGMIEVIPVGPMLQEIRKTVKDIKIVGFVSTDTESDRKEYEGLRKEFEEAGIKTKSYWAQTFEQWKKAFVAAQENDMVFLVNVAGLKGFNKDEAIDFAKKNTKKLSIGSLPDVAYYSAFMMKKLGEEQGEWSAEAAIKILKGTAPSSIPFVKNKRYELIVNPPILEKAPVKLDAELLKKATKL